MHSARIGLEKIEDQMAAGLEMFPGTMDAIELLLNFQQMLEGTKRNNDQRKLQNNSAREQGFDFEIRHVRMNKIQAGAYAFQQSGQFAFRLREHFF